MYAFCFKHKMVPPLWEGKDVVCYFCLQVVLTAFCNHNYLQGIHLGSKLSHYISQCKIRACPIQCISFPKEIWPPPPLLWQIAPFGLCMKQRVQSKEANYCYCRAAICVSLICHTIGNYLSQIRTHLYLSHFLTNIWILAHSENPHVSFHIYRKQSHCISAFILFCSYSFIASLFLHHSSCFFGYRSIVHHSDEEGAIRERAQRNHFMNMNYVWLIRRRQKRIWMQYFFLFISLPVAEDIANEKQMQRTC